MSVFSHDPWPNQVYAFSETQRAFDEGDRMVAVTSVTGGGKSRMMFEQIQEHNGRAIVLANRRMLLAQLARNAKAAGFRFGFRAANHKELVEASGMSIGYDKGGDPANRELQLAMTQSECGRVLTRGEPLHPAEVVIVDECHLHTSDRICELLRRYVANGARVVGYSATPVDLRDVGYERLITAGTTSEMRACGALVPEIRYAPDEPDMRGEKPSYSTGEFSESQVMDAMFGRMIEGDHKKPPIIGRVLESWLKYSPVHSHTLLFAPSVAASVWFAEAFLDAGYRACSIDGEHIWLDGVTHDSHEPGLREKVAELHKAGEIKVVCNRFVLREGIDWPWVRCGIFATVFGGLASFIQSGGRLLRACPGKDSVCVIDHGGNWHRHGSLNADRQWTLGMTNHEVTKEREERFREPPAAGESKPLEPIVCSKCARVRTGTSIWSPKCPFCGHIANAKSRLVMTADGQLYERRGDIYGQYKVERKSDTQKIWEQCYWRAKKSRKGMTFQQARALFMIENNYYPPKDLPLMPERAIDWRRRVSDVPRNLLISDPIVANNQGDAV